MIRGQQVLQEHGRDALLPIGRLEAWGRCRSLATGSGFRLVEVIGSGRRQRLMGFVGVHASVVGKRSPAVTPRQTQKLGFVHTL